MHQFLPLNSPHCTFSQMPPAHGVAEYGPILSGCSSLGRAPHPEPPSVKQHFPIVMAAILWGHRWTGPHALYHSGNAGAVCQVNQLHTHSPNCWPPPEMPDSTRGSGPSIFQKVRQYGKQPSKGRGVILCTRGPHQCGSSTSSVSAVGPSRVLIEALADNIPAAGRV